MSKAVFVFLLIGDRDFRLDFNACSSTESKLYEHFISIINTH